MELHEKIQFMRTLRGWSQEEMAEKLVMSAGGYAKIERGETDIHYSRIKQIAQILGVETFTLFEPQGKIIINIGETQLNGDNCGHKYEISNLPKDLAHELEKANLLNQQKDKEISLLYEQISQLKQFIELIKKD